MVARFPYLTNLRLDVEDPTLLPAGTVLNRVANPSPRNRNNGFGWTPGYAITAVHGYPYYAEMGVQDGSAGTSPPGFYLTWTPAAPLVARQMTTPCGAVAGGETVIVGWDCVVPIIGNQIAHSATLEALNAAGDVVSSTSSVESAALGARTIGPVTLPSTARTLRLKLTGAAGASTSYQFAYVDNIRVGVGVTDPTKVVERRYTNVLPSATQVQVTREDLNLGTLTAPLLNEALDPSTNPLLRPNRQVRLYTTNGTEKKYLFVGTISDATATYLPKKGPKRVRIDLTAVDRVSLLAQTKRPDSYGDAYYAGIVVQEVMPFQFDGKGSTVSPNGGGSDRAKVVAQNASATALDQIALIRDTISGYAWVDRDGVAILRRASQMPTAVKRVLTTSDYDSTIDVGFDLEQVINTVTVISQRINLANGETVEDNFGPFTRESSVFEWGPRAAEFKVMALGLFNSNLNARSFAEKVFDAQATPVRRVKSATLRVKTLADAFVAGAATTQKGLLDLYDLVTVQTPQGNQTSRVAAITHTITPRSWQVGLGFVRNGGIAPPQAAPSLASPAPAIAGTPWFMGSNRGTRTYEASVDVPFSTIVADPTGGWSKTNPNRWTAPRDGLYRVTFTWKWNGSTTAKPGRVLVNGVNRVYGPAIPAVAFGGSSISVPLQMVAGDTVSAQVDVAMTTQADGALVDNNFLLIEPLEY